ncbi:MAG: mannose-1-phosphate guanylyltransferase/mannose-6-phosphate isomerase [Desulfobacterales bacterium]|nr:mannose-1-phosphate guanylyltransferase/mannose-6-phosphate isomerase [Desulfobacterales bacterium]
MIIPVILAGGSGTRLWPLSRKMRPKQLIDLVDDNTMLQNTVLRLQGAADMAAPMMLCNEDHRFMVAEQLRSIDIVPESIILEPVGRNTAPALAVAALQAIADGADPILLVLPADHFIRDLDLFYRTLTAGAGLAERGYLITFGIVPESPETGYGYIKKGSPIEPDAATATIESTRIDKFVEKPDQATAQNYVDTGDYCWNSGMFMFKASRVLEELEKFNPDIVAACRNALTKGIPDLDFLRLDPESFAACPSDSIDYAIMEKTDKGAMIMFRAGWDDVGSWEALWQVGDKDASGNITHGDVLTHDVDNSYINAGSRLVAAVGLKNHVVVETSDAVLISPRDRAQDVKHLVEKLKAAGREEVNSHRKHYRPWGWTLRLVDTPDCRVNQIRIRPRKSITLQKHFNRAEHWIVVKGTALVKRGNEKLTLQADESTYITMGMEHRLENPDSVPLEIIEVQTGQFIEEDIVRLNGGR